MSVHFILTIQVIKLKLKEGRGQLKGNQFCLLFILNKLYGVRLGSSLLGDYSCVISKAG